MERLCRWLEDFTARHTKPTAPSEDDPQRDEVKRRLEDAQERLRMLEWQADVASRRKIRPWPPPRDPRGQE